jgi:multisubunit Na+/H+ antiporter MnhG subunit
MIIFLSVAAYIDPNSGGLLFQILAAVFVFVSSLFLFFSSRIKMGFARLRRAFRERHGPAETQTTGNDQQAE